MMLEIVPVSITEANDFVEIFHRHHGKVTAARFAVAVSDGETIRGVAIVGNPVARHLCDGWTLEVNRCCTDGVKNGCSILYGAAWRIAKAMGFRRLITYTLVSEGGTSLRAAGWKCLGERKGGSWNRPNRPRNEKRILQKYLWEVCEDARCHT
jgi:hypothetical protein